MSGRILVAVDFGTTFSAIGYAHVEDDTAPADIKFHIVDEGWPGQGLRRSPKVPTVFKLGEPFEMGFQVEDDPDRVSFSKLFLDKDQVRKGQKLADFTKLASEYNDDDLMKGVTKYLAALRKRALEHMEQTWDAEFVRSHIMDFTLSVPAIWSENAKQKTMKCAESAKMGSQDRPGSIRPVSEPEAAAAYAITTMPDEAWKIGSRCVIVDAGGGTVDLTTYRIAQLKPRLELDERHCGDGGLCGSAMLNLRFMELMRLKIGDHISKEELNDIMLEFNDEIKPSFDGEDEDHIIQIPLTVPDNLAEGIADGSLVITAAELREVFDPPINRILYMIQGQIDAIQDAEATERISMLLVGGFGSSQYLRKKVEERFKDCKVMQPPDAWSAVVRGALLRGSIKTRKIRAHYGIKFSEPWDPAKHETGPLAPFAGSHKYWDGHFEHKFFCGDRMNWYVKKGDVFEEGKTVEFPFYACYGVHNKLDGVEIEMWTYLDGKEGNDGPPFKDLDCRVAARLNPELYRIPRDTLTRVRSQTGDDYYRISYKLVMTFDTMIEFKLKYKGEILGNVKAEYVDIKPDDLNMRGQ